MVTFVNPTSSRFGRIVALPIKSIEFGKCDIFDYYFLVDRNETNVYSICFAEGNTKL